MDEKTLRATLAGYAMQGLLAGGITHEGVPAAALRLADALLVELKKDSPAPAEAGPPRPFAAPAGVGDVSQDSQQEPRASGKQVAGDDGFRHMPEGPHGTARRPAEDRQVAPVGHGFAEGGPPTPAAVARWGRVAGPGAAWHLWRDSEAACGEAAEAQIEWLPINAGMDPEMVCLDCKDIDVHAHMAAAPAIHARTLPPKHRCAGFNKAAGVTCNSPEARIPVGEQWFCRRHNPGKAKKLPPPQEVAA